MKLRRQTKHSAGYDIPVIKGATVLPGETHVFDTECAFKIKEDEVAMIYSRSSLGFKKDLMLVNSVGIIDSDFYPNTIKIKVYNFGKKPRTIKDGERLAQAVIVNYNTLELDEFVDEIRNGGIGSTGRK